MKLEKRSAFGWPATAAGYAPCKNGLVVHYDGSNQGLAGKSHASCRAYWKATRTFHMGPSRGWLDIGYSFGVCPHGIVMEGRGWQKNQAAQPGGNTTWTSCTFMSGDSEHPTDAQVNAFRELRAWLRGKGLAAAIKGHRDFISTSCPGTVLYRMVRDGALTGTPYAPPAKPTYWDVQSTVADRRVRVPWATPTLREGSEGARVKWLQDALNGLGAKLTVDGDFGPDTKKALKAFQAKHVDENGKRLAVDSVYGHHTARSLFIAHGGKKEDAL